MGRESKENALLNKQ